jgi:two-component system chemotaxis response regulator CheY
MRKIIKRVLRQAEIAVDSILEASNGIEALEQLVANPDVGLILSDINMPEMNGIDLVKAVREAHSTEALPVIMVTTEGGEAMIASAMSSGANGYVTKPFTPDSIRCVLDPYFS